MFVFICKAQPLASGMFLCHFQILCGVPAERMDRAGTRPGQGSRDTVFKMPVFLQQPAKFVVISSCDTCLWNLPWGSVYTPDRAEFDPQGPPPRPPTLLTVLSAAGDNFLSRPAAGMEGGQKEGLGPF